MLARTDQISRALADLKEEYQGLLTKASSPLGRLRFLIGVLAGLSANLDQPDIPTRLDVEGITDLQGLHTWVHREAKALAQLFDARAGTAHYADEIARALTARRVALPAGGVPSWTAMGATADVGEPATASGGESGASPTTGDPAADPIGALAPHDELARVAEEGGFLADAGRHWAEAAHEAQLAGDDASAHARYATAVPRLLVGDAPLALVARVIAAWAPTAARLDQTDDILCDLSSALTASTAILGEDQELARVRADLLDTRARILASTRPDLHDDIVRDAVASAELYAQAERIADAAHSFWLAGRIQRDNDRATEAIWSLESAVEGFRLARDREHRALVAGELIELLRATGQPDRADALTATLIG